jgi:hypothetical protein
MKPVVLALLLGLALLRPAAASGHRLECPAVAPADWALPQARLSAVAVLAAKEGEPIVALRVRADVTCVYDPLIKDRRQQSGGWGRPGSEAAI